LTVRDSLGKVRTMTHSIFARLLLIFALLFAQTGSLVHGIAHAVTDPAQTSDHSLPHNKHCDQCAAYAQIGSALGSHEVSLTLPEQLTDLSCTSFGILHTSAAFAAFAARAPPHFA
jgi:hypothetical protein